MQRYAADVQFALVA